jgi:hypothetical protein
VIGDVVPGSVPPEEDVPPDEDDEDGGFVGLFDVVSSSLASVPGSFLRIALQPTRRIVTTPAVTSRFIGRLPAA